MHVQVWSPDTCGCVIHQRVDDDGTVTNISEDEANAILDGLHLEARVHVDVATGGARRVSIVDGPQPPGRICPHHLHSPNPHDAVLHENQGKNQALDEAQKIKPGLTGEHYRWSFDENRVLQVEFDLPLSAAEKGQLQAALHARLGQGKARVR